MRGIRSCLPLVGLAMLVTAVGCASTQSASQITSLESIGERSKFLVMTPDVKYYMLTAGGMPEPNAELTSVARDNFLTALKDFAAERDAEVVMLDPADTDDELIVRYEKLHSAVGSTILISHFGPAKLPTKAGRFDWSLGPGVRELADMYGADYALFSFYRDYQATGGRVAFAMLALVAGVAVPTSMEFGFASLVDMQTGDVVWFNTVSLGEGELRKQGGARKVVDNLFQSLPEG